MGIVRLALALAVIGSHLGAFPGYAGMTGGEAVQCFFIISGFYMAMILNEKYGPGQYRAFLKSRCLRIYPLYLAVLGLSFLASLAIGNRSAAGVLLLLPDYADMEVLGLAAKVLFLAASVLLVGISWLSFHTAVDPGTATLRFYPSAYGQPCAGSTFFVVPQAWSLDLEVCFYCLAPFIVRRRSLVLAALGASLGVDLLLRAGVFGEHAMRNTLPAQLWLFCLGALAYGAYAHLKGSRRLGRLPLAAFCASLGLVCLYRLLPGPIGAFLGVLLFAACVPLVFLHTRENRRDRMLGELSYPIYLVHFLVFSLLEAWSGPLSAGMKIAAVSLTLALSWGLYVSVGRPMDRLRHAMPEAPVAGGAVTPPG